MSADRPGSRTHGLLVPVWVPAEENQVANPAYEFTRRFTTGNEKIVWTKKRVALPRHFSNCMINWLNDCCRVISELGRDDLCVLHIYTTQAALMLTSHLRDQTGVRELGLLHDASTESTRAEELLRQNLLHSPSPKVLPEVP